MPTRARAPRLTYLLGFQPVEDGRSAIEDLPSSFHESRPAPGIRPAPKGFLANTKFLGEVGAADPALQQRAVVHPHLRCLSARLKLRHLRSPDCRPLWANVVSQLKHSGRGGRVAVTGSEIAVAATPRATPYFIDRAEILAAMRRDLQDLQTRRPTTRDAAEKPDRRNFRSFAKIGGVSATFRGGSGWQ
jgi:hypothetical protein